jgi:outer membrane protein OmpA-like peptidoglycan-associated protein
MGEKANYALYPPQNLYYVQIGKYESYEKARVHAHWSRELTSLDSTWVFKAMPFALNEGTEVEKDVVIEDEMVIDTASINEVVTVIPEKIEPKVEEELPVVKIYFNTYLEKSNKEVFGRIEVIDPDKSERYEFKDSRKVVDVPMSINESGDIELVAEIFGYKKIQHNFNLNDPINEQTSSFLSYEDSVLIVDFQLEAYTAGDVVTNYNVYFYKDAVIMRPESKTEVLQLLKMLNENSAYNIMLMGHTNGNNSGPIIEMEPGSNNYFSDAGNTVESKGSAKKLSTLRAELIRQYLLSEGIDPTRIEAKGFGGKESLYNKYDSLAYKNVRVEIKILDE